MFICKTIIFIFKDDFMSTKIVSVYGTISLITEIT